jgi:NAD(P)-dependent dehydrogenase (short-subunit alcohol dehydrogenase family)
VTAVIGETGKIGQVNYTASKSGLFGMTKSMAREAVCHLQRPGLPVGDGIGLTVNAVTPGFIATDMPSTVPDKLLERIRGQIPVGPAGPARSGRSTAAWRCERRNSEPSA